mgnify:CR=1 FL=1
MKKEFEIPEMKVICFEAEDVIATSEIVGEEDEF